MAYQLENPIELKSELKELQRQYEILSNCSSDDSWFDADELMEIKNKIEELKIRYDTALAEFWLMNLEN